jgi:hypothetical protein
MIPALHLIRTDSTPEVHLDAEKNIFKISGESRPENIRKFYDPIFDWIDSYLAQLRSSMSKSEVVLEISFDYFNSTTAKMIYDIIIKFNEGSKVASFPFKVNWMYDSFDQDLLSSGRSLQKFTKANFEFIERSA